MTRAESRGLCARAQALIDVGRGPAALELLRDACAADPTDPEPHCLVGVCHLVLGDGPKAVEAARLALALEPDNLWALRIMASAYRTMPGYAREMIAAAEEVLRIEPNDAAGLRIYARVLSDLHRADDAERAAARALELRPNDPLSAQTAGMLALDRDELQLAREWFRAELRLDPTSWTAHNNLGLIAAKVGNDIGAARHLLRSIRIRPTQTPIDNLNGVVFRSMAALFSTIAVVASGVTNTLTAQYHLAVVIGLALFNVLLGLSTLRFMRNAPRSLRAVIRENVAPVLRMTGVCAVLLNSGEPRQRVPPSRRLAATVLGASALLISLTAGFLPIAFAQPLSGFTFLNTLVTAGAWVWGMYLSRQLRRLRVRRGAAFRR